MTDAIWKFPLEITDQQVVNPDSAYIERALWVGVDPNGVLCLWCEVSTRSKRRRPATVTIVGTGNPFPLWAGLYIGSAVMARFVWHVYVSGLQDVDFDDGGDR